MNVIDLLMIKINELQIELMAQAAELAKTKERLDHLEESVNHE